ncbi:DoxX family protein [Niallia nealsonii]|uniref:Oxidoreductase n=1 Tax=Niallia nealsonii TaxID=115979 RepID=A0A2N0Z1E1_9BACI|nr:DoxX family protein [Niallia nealsonii]PKG23332.1 oxidoreductase [Niallia nealsonii]
MFTLQPIGTLFIRFVLGIIFFMHGLTKMQNGIENTAGFFTSLGLPGFSAYLVAGIELIGGLLIIIGLGTRIIAVLFAAIMLGAILMVNGSNGFVGGYEFELSLLAMSLFLVFNQAQVFALDNILPFYKSKQQSA